MMGPSDAPYPDWESWTPGPHDTGQADECTRERAAYRLFAADLSDEELCARALRAMECQRVSAELHRAAMALATGDTPADGRQADAEVFDPRLTGAITGLNLMGIETLLPGEFGAEEQPSTAGVACIYLGGEPAAAHERVDALSGLIREFHRSDIIISGLRIREPDATGHPKEWALVAVHPAVIESFGEFLIRKYVVEAWRLG